MSATALHEARQLDLGPLYQDYAYGYPHKSAYRAFPSPQRLREVWSEERKDRLFLYLHVPFCEMRCGFCNLFTTANPAEDRIAQYLDALSREMDVTRDELGNLQIAQMAIGGGTPTFLGAAALDALFGRLTATLGANSRTIPTAIETSPKTATPETLACLAEWGVERISIGVQSFVEAETRAMGRAQVSGELEKALNAIRDHRFDRLNIDLIYGTPNQTVTSWVGSIQQALNWTPEEIYLYPLYIRPRTGLEGRTCVEDEHRRSLYRAGRDYLLAEGYEQLSMRAFRRSAPGVAPSAEYSCQEDGMLGLGAGARSYTRQVHYSTEYGVSRRAVRGILEDYASRSTESFRYALHGVRIDDDERMRRFILKSIFRQDGLDDARFKELFRCPADIAFPILDRLVNAGMLVRHKDVYHPTTAGLEHSDALPPLFYSAAVRERMMSASVT